MQKIQLCQAVLHFSRRLVFLILNSSPAPGHDPGFHINVEWKRTLPGTPIPNMKVLISGCREVQVIKNFRSKTTEGRTDRRPVGRNRRILLRHTKATSYAWGIITNSHTQCQIVQIQISWLLLTPTDLDLHCLQKKGISGVNRTRHSTK